MSATQFFDFVSFFVVYLVKTGDKTAAIQSQRLRPTICDPVAFQVDGATQRGEPGLLANQGVKH